MIQEKDWVNLGQQWSAENKDQARRGSIIYFPRKVI